MNLFGRELTRHDLLRRVGNVAQVGGVTLMSYENGHARGTRLLDFRTGSGFRFGVLVDRGMDPGPAEFAGASLHWEPPKGYANPAFYEDISQYSWLRYGLGGLCNTAGIVAIGDRQTLPLDFNFAARASDFYGIHGHIAVTPAASFSFGERWENNDCILWAEGLVREDIAYGENLSMVRRYETKLGSKSFTLTDVITNDGFYSTPHQLLYHFNIGYPVVDDGAELLHTLSGPVDSYSFADAIPNDFEKRYRRSSEPQPRWGHVAGDLPMLQDKDGWVSVALVNRGADALFGGFGVFMRYDGRVLPSYTHNHMMAEGLYTIGMEPATNPVSPVPELVAHGYPVMLEPGESRTYRMDFGVLQGPDEIATFEASLPRTDEAATSPGLRLHSSQGSRRQPG